MIPVALDAEPMKTVIRTMAEKKIALDPTLVVVEGVLLANAGTVSPAYTAYIGTLPPATERNFKAGPIPYPEGMTRADAVASVKKMGVYVSKLRAAGVPIVPVSADSTPEMILIMVDLPAPFSPTSAFT